MVGYTEVIQTAFGEISGLLSGAFRGPSRSRPHVAAICCRLWPPAKPNRSLFRCCLNGFAKRMFYLGRFALAARREDEDDADGN
jgi:hypothetical protein